MSRITAELRGGILQVVLPSNHDSLQAMEDRLCGVEGLNTDEPIDVAETQFGLLFTLRFVSNPAQIADAIGNVDGRVDFLNGNLDVMLVDGHPQVDEYLRRLRGISNIRHAEIGYTLTRRGVRFTIPFYDHPGEVVSHVLDAAKGL